MSAVCVRVFFRLACQDNRRPNIKDVPTHCFNGSMDIRRRKDNWPTSTHKLIHRTWQPKKKKQQRQWLDKTLDALLLLFCRTTPGWKAWKLCVYINVGGSWLNPPSMDPQIEVLKTAWTVSVLLWLDDRAPPPTLHASSEKESGPRTQQQGLGWSGLNTTTPGRRLHELLDLLSYSAQDISIADVTLYINYIFWKDAISFCYLSNCVLHKLHQQRPRFVVFFVFLFL